MKTFQETFFETILTGKNRIYHNNFIATHTKALSQIYSAVQALIGEVCFENVARVYIPQNISTSYKLQDYGKNFPNFLENFEPLKSLVYLSDVARLEWAINEIFYANDDFFSTVRFIQSTYPVLSIWELCRENNLAEKHATLDLSQGGQHIMLRRKGREIIFIHQGEVV